MARYGQPRPHTPPTPSPTPAPAPKPTTPPVPADWYGDVTLPPTFSDRAEKHAAWMFDSVPAARVLLDTVPAHKAGKSSSTVTGPDDRFYGEDGTSYDLVEGYAMHGWPAGTARALKYAETLREHLPPVDRHRVTFDVAPGTHFDIGRVIEGEPECWVGPSNVRATPVRILCNLVCSSSVTADEMLQRGAVLTALVIALQDAGESVELWVGEGVREDHERREYAIRVQEAGCPTSIDTLAYWLGHPCALRRHFFRLTEHLFPEASLSGYGYPADLIIVPREFGPFDQVINFNRGNHQWDTEEKALAWITRQLGKFIAKEHYTKEDLAHA